MKYFIRFIVALPAMSVAFAGILTFAIGFDYPILFILAALLSIAFITMMSYYEDTVKEFTNLLNIIFNQSKQTTI